MGYQRGGDVMKSHYKHEDLRGAYGPNSCLDTSTYISKFLHFIGTIINNGTRTD